MKKIILAISIVSFLVFLAGCNNKSAENHDNNSSSDTNTSENKENETNTSENRDTKNKKQSDNKGQEKKNNDSNESHQTTDKNKSYLNNFSTEKIEYARVWYQLISTKNDLKGIRNVYVTKIPKGSKVNPQAQDSAVYKEDVVKLEAPMKAGGSVTYSSNGDGSINVYNSIPYKWESPQNSDYSQMDKITRKAIEDNVETIYINPHDNKTVAKLANKVKYNK
ncbi:hypothetical protein P3T86_13880 (plasmid) [Staphylococcus nepalensis]|uniref:hypothetical protein n=1 Tax=Staphylococcus nepalensis TaxID=214473 RepID=UPI0023014E33|nr:hypothetical protein [Staphylococcus nepalensis]WQL21568.1 hypothetical protein P3T86_13880 [Staphylococcus nepalensis]